MNGGILSFQVPVTHLELFEKQCVGYVKTGSIYIWYFDQNTLLFQAIATILCVNLLFFSDLLQIYEYN